MAHRVLRKSTVVPAGTSHLLIRDASPSAESTIVSKRALSFSFVISLWFTSAQLIGQQPVGQPQGENQEAMVQLNFPNEIEVRALIDYVSQRVGVQILYDEQVANKSVTVRAPNPVPASSLMGVLASALKMKGLVIVDADAPGWKRVVEATQMPNVAPGGTAEAAIRDYGRGTPVTQAFVLKHVDPEQVDQVIQKFLTEPGANSIVFSESGTLIVTDYATNVLRISDWIKKIDLPRPDVVIERVPVEHISADELARQVTLLLTAKSRAEGGRQPAANVEVAHDVRTNHLLLVGQQSDVQQVKQLITSLDVPLGMSTKAYRFQFVEAARVDRLIKQFLDPVSRSTLYQGNVDEQDNMLVVSATAEIHQKITQLRESLDQAPDQAQSPIRFYKVTNLPVMELLNTIRAVEREGSGLPFDRNPEWRRLPTDGRIRPARAQAVTGPNRLPQQPGSSSFSAPPAVVEPDRNLEVLPGAPREATPEQDGVETSVTPTGVAVQASGGLEGGDAFQLLGQARISADIHTNTLIVVAQPGVQRLYAELIKKLDQRRPQVLIDTRFVIIDGSDDMSFGVEISTGDRSGARRALAFTQFGLSTVDPVTGALSILPGLGFNGTVVDPDTADVVIRALTNHRRSRVVASPRIVVNDNATGQLSSVAEVPFTSINASQTVATTSFAGFAEAGTTITVTPRISDGDHLELDFAITLNSFTGPGGDGVPPPRQTDEVTSQVTIPDGHTVIVGGLNRRNQSVDYSGIPIIELIPILRYLNGSETKANAWSSMYIFIRPVILRDDKFRDLRYYSGRDARCARICPDTPSSQPMWMR